MFFNIIFGVLQYYFYIQLACSCNPPPPPPAPPPAPPFLYQMGQADFPCELEDALWCVQVKMNYQALMKADEVVMVYGSDIAVFKRNYTWSIKGNYLAHFNVSRLFFLIS
jgi:hypothetical protein